MKTNICSLWNEDIRDIIYGYRLWREDSNNTVYFVYGKDGFNTKVITYDSTDVVFEKRYQASDEKQKVVFDIMIINFLSQHYETK